MNHPDEEKRDRQKENHPVRVRLDRGEEPGLTADCDIQILRSIWRNDVLDSLNDGLKATLILPELSNYGDRTAIAR